MKQLQLAATLYGNDNHDYLAANVIVRNGGDNLSDDPTANPLGARTVRRHHTKGTA